MKKFLFYIFSIVIVLGTIIPNFSSAQTALGSCYYTYKDNTTGVVTNNIAQDVDQAYCSATNKFLVPPGTTLVSIDKYIITGQRTPNVTIDGTNGIEAGAKVVSSFWNWMDPFSWIPKILSMLVYVVMKILSLFLSLAGLLLNYTIQITIMEMADRVNAMSGINVAWKVLRDLMNIGFIFMLLYQGIKLIISQDSIDSIRSFIIGIVLASLFINFSLFFTKVLIDTSNIATVGIYNTIIGDSASASSGMDRGLSNALMTSLGITRFFSYDTILTGEIEDNYSQLTSNIMACILIIVSTIVFLAITAMFVTRYIVLILLLALSPIAYMGMAFTGLKKYSDKWWDTLWGQLIFAPLYMLMSWVTLTLIAGNFTAKVDPIQLGTWSLSASTNIFFNFALIIGLTLASLFIAKEYSTKGASEVGKLSSSITSFAGGAMMGGAAFAGRGLLGRAALMNTNTEELQQRAAEGGWQGRRAQARLALATSSFDARKTGIVGQISKQTGVNLGSGLPFNPKAGEGGRAATVANNKKEYETNADAVVKRYTEKGDWAGLANYMKTGKPKTMSQADWEATQKYIYNKKLDARGRIALDSAIADRALTQKLQDKLPTSEQVKRLTEAKDWDGLASFMMTKPDGTPRSEQDRADIYRTLNDRDRAALERTVEFDVTTPAGLAAINSMKGSLSLDEQINVYKNRKDWSGLSSVILGATADRQEYIYEKLSPRERIDLDPVLERLSPGLPSALRGSLSNDDQDKTMDALITERKRARDWVGLSAVIGTSSTNRQNYIYEKLSARERVELDSVLDTIPASPAMGGMSGTAIKDQMKAALSSEEQEKTKTETRKVRAAQEQDHLVENLEDLVAGVPVRHPAAAPAGGGPAPANTFDTEMLRLSPKEAHNLSNDALKNPQVIQRLTPQHLADILANKDDLDQSTKDAIVYEIIKAPMPALPKRLAQIKYMNSSELTKANWGI